MKDKKELLKARKKIINATKKAIDDFSMIEDGDSIMVCISGGKDSYTMLDMMIHFQKYGKTNFNFIARSFFNAPIWRIYNKTKELNTSRVDN